MVAHFESTTMRIIVISIIAVVLSFLNAFSQQFRTLDQYQQYFIENCRAIDKIEGSWYVHKTLFVDNVFLRRDEFIVVIIKQSGEFFQYTIEDGYYKPTAGYKKYIKKMPDYFYSVQYESDCNTTMTSNSFSLFNNKFSYSVDITRHVKCLLPSNEYRSVTANYSFSKMYPLDADIKGTSEHNRITKTTGTAFVISSDGYVVTNYHVIENANSLALRCY
jgi:S1-C subfamily serine protease